MTRHVLGAGVGEKKWTQLVSTLNKRSDRRIALIYRFLKRLKDCEWRAINTTWNLPNATEEMWENMHNAFDDVSFPEMVRLNNDRRLLRDAWAVFKVQYKAVLDEERRLNVYEGEDEHT